MAAPLLDGALAPPAGARREGRRRCRLSWGRLRRQGPGTAAGERVRGTQRGTQIPAGLGHSRRTRKQGRNTTWALPMVPGAQTNEAGGKVWTQSLDTWAGCPHAYPGGSSWCRGKGKEEGPHKGSTSQRHPVTQRWEKCHLQRAEGGPRERRWGQDSLAGSQHYRKHLGKFCTQGSRPLARPGHEVPSPAALAPPRGSESVRNLREPQQQAAAGKEDPEGRCSLAWTPSIWKSGSLAFYSFFQWRLAEHLPRAICLLGPGQIHCESSPCPHEAQGGRMGRRRKAHGNDDASW